MQLSCLVLLAAVQASQIPQQPLVIEDYFSLKHIDAVAAGPDGGSVAFTVSGAALEDDEHRTELYVWRAATGARAVAPDFVSVQLPRWSRDGTWLAFLNRGPEAASARQLWLAPVLTGDPPFQLGEFAGGVIDYDWAPDGSIYALTVSTESGAREFWRILIPGGTAEFVWGGDPGIREMAVSPAGSAIVYSSNGSGAAEDYLNYDLRILELESGSIRRLASRPGPDVAPVWSPDGRTIVFQAPQDPRYLNSQTELLRVPASGGSPEVVTGSFDRSVVEHRWPAAGDLIFTAAVGTHTHLFALTGSGAIRPLTRGAFDFGAFDARDAAMIFAVREAATQAAELYRIDESAVEPLTDFNARAANWGLGRQQVIRWNAPDGQSVEGVLIYPASYEEGRRYPLLVHTSGGRGGRVRDVLAQPGAYQLFAAQGYAVMAVNPRGSSGYGEVFATANRNDLAGGDVVDLLAGVDIAIAMGLADADRLAIYGSDWGAELASWSLTRTRRFAAAVAVYRGLEEGPGRSGAGTASVQRASLAGVYEGAPGPDRSAAANARYIETPLLIIETAEEPARWVPRFQPADLYRALSDLDRAVEYVRPTAGARFAATPRGRRSLFFRQLRWFDKYLKFGGADVFDFYLVEEWVPGPQGWELSVTSAAPRVDYTGMRPESGRYLEVAMTLRAAESARRVRTLSLDPATGLSLVGPDGTLRRLTGTVTEVFGQETLILGTPAPESLQPGGSTPSTFRLAFEIPDQAGEYRLLVEGFQPVRIWVPASE
jgi:dipeptidyl aminopeptidase/acylaminoacyl peptidase